MSRRTHGARRRCLVLAPVLAAAAVPALAQGRGGGASAAEYEGWRQYMVNCARCHGDDAVAGVTAPDLRTSVAKGRLDSAGFHAVVAGGRSGRGMPGFKDVLTDRQIAAIHAYVRARATGRLPAGRPR
ncbi:MAG TPA: c-type cytochrome [Gemmatimonadales bacterium]|nr:c-type cytochrome [Gemmatimonadales bacterium]